MLKLDAKKLIGAVLLVLLLMSSIPATVYAAGLGSSPPSIEITDALRGNNYQRTIRFFSSAEEPVTLSLSANGAISDWVTYYSFDEPNKPITEALVSEKSNVTIITKIAIPADASNGEYIGSLNADTKPSDSIISGAGVAVSLHTSIVMNISITGVQKLEGSVDRVEIENTEIGLPLNIDVSFRNTGNVIANPIFNVKIIQNENIIDEFSNSETVIDVDSSDTIGLQWDTSGNNSGAYNAEISVQLGDTQIYDERIAFRILPRGGLSSEGRLTGIMTEGKSEVGTMTKILATFENTSVVEALVNGYAEIYLDEALLTVLDSAQLEVNGGEQGTLTFYFNPDQPGDYEIKVHAIISGRETNTVQLSLTVESAEVIPVGSTEVIPTPTPTQVVPAQTADTSEEGITGIVTDTELAAYWYVIISIAGAIVIAGAYLFIWRRKQFVPVLVGSYNKVYHQLTHSKFFKKIRFNNTNSKKRKSNKTSSKKIKFLKLIFNGRK
jgi:hypothetical protein